METTHVDQTSADDDTETLPRVKKPEPPSPAGTRYTLRTWLTAWELYPILLVAAFLRFYQLSLTEFDTDQAVLWNTARTALAHGLIPTASNLSSIGTPHFPLTIYIFMLVGLFTANPLAGAAVTALFNVLAVLLTYIFTRRYFGRLAGFVAAALTATAVVVILYSRFIWQPNLVAPLLVLYMLAIFRGAVERRPGWLMPALVLLALSFQLGESCAYLVPVLLLALVFGYKTVHWRDWIIGLGISALFFVPYAVLEVANHFADLPLFLGSGGHSSIDSLALKDYLHFVVAYTTRPTAPQMLLTRIFPLLYLHRLVMLALTVASLGLILLGLFWKRVQVMASGAFSQVAASAPVSAGASTWRRLWARWNELTASPQSRALLLLVAWQILPLVLLLRHTVSLQVHYLLTIMPGPFVLVGLLVSQLATWSTLLPVRGKVLRLVVPVLATLLILAQTLIGVAWILDNTDGNQAKTTNENTLLDLSNAVQAADQLAQSRHLQHVYIDADTRITDSMDYLAQQMRTPYTVINNNSSHCLVLPESAQGPAVMLFGPTRTLDEALLTRFASATLVSSPPRLGGAPFHLYIVQPATSDSAAGGSGSLTLAQSQAPSLNWQDPGAPGQPAQHVLATFWHNQTPRGAQAGSWWTYHFSATYSGNGTDGNSGSADCQLTSLTPGEQLLVPFSLPTSLNALPGEIALNGTIASNQPLVLNYGPLHFQTISTTTTTLATFQGTIKN